MRNFKPLTSVTIFVQEASHSQADFVKLGPMLTGQNDQIRVFITLALLLTSLVLFAHPEDEFCTPGDGGLDPALCAALAELDSQDSRKQITGSPEPMDDLAASRTTIETLSVYVSIGIQHIMPNGLDHILFVLAIFLASIRTRALLLQISAFTVAHTVTLALAGSGLVNPAAAIVEPLIALTIGFVAIENLFFKEMTKWRPGIVFAFGLVHGLGFAGFFGELGLPPGQFWSALIGFNIGVELGQIAVVVVAAMLGVWIRNRLSDTTATRQYRQFVVLPGSALIGLVGFWWAAERAFL